MIHLSKFEFAEQIALSNRGLQAGGKVQMFIDNEVIRLMDSYTPFRDGDLKAAAQKQTKIGSGEIIQDTPYAKRQYYNPQYNFNEAPQRGAQWFERMKADHKDNILRGAAEIAGGKK